MHSHPRYLNDVIMIMKMKTVRQLRCSQAERNTLSFVSLLAEEGDKLNVGGEGQRGGLLTGYEDGLNLLQVLAGHPYYDDSICLDLLKTLRKSQLLKKEDVTQYYLSYRSCKPVAEERFEYFVDWDPEALNDIQVGGDPFLHTSAAWLCIDSFALALKAGLKYYPEELGFLFQKNDRGKTAFEMACQHYGKDKARRAIEKCFEEAHNVKMVERNPATNLYPFMLAAAGETTELNTVYYLLRRNPLVLEDIIQEKVRDVDVETKRRRLS